MLLCAAPEGTALHDFHSSCPHTHICFNRLESHMSHQLHTAWCMNGAPSIGFGGTAQQLGFQVAVWPLDGSSAPNSIEVVLTEENNNRRLLRARSISLVAGDVDGNTIAQVASCQDCSRLGLSQWPGHTSRLLALINLSDPIDRATLHASGWF